MQQSKLKELKENKEVKFIYKLPSSLYEEGFEYIIVGDVTISDDNIKVYSLDDWFLMMRAGSIKGYVCATSPKKYKIKEYLNIYNKPDLLTLRTYILHLTNEYDIIQESLWGEQLIKDGKIYQVDVFKTKYTSQEAKQRFIDAVYPMYKHNIDINKS